MAKNTAISAANDISTASAQILDQAAFFQSAVAQVRQTQQAAQHSRHDHGRGTHRQLPTASQAGLRQRHENRFRFCVTFRLRPALK
jgi:hypothetical protein